MAPTAARAAAAAVSALLLRTTCAFQPPQPPQWLSPSPSMRGPTAAAAALRASTEGRGDDDAAAAARTTSHDRRWALGVLARTGLASGSLASAVSPGSASARSDAASGTGAYDATDQYAPKFVQEYADFAKTDEGWSYKDVKVGSGDVVVEEGDRVVFDWSGYTIGYFGRPFEAKGGPRGGAFDKDLDYSRTIVGSGSIVPGLECSLRTMKPGGVRQVVIPYGPLSYPPDDLEHVRVGPKPSTFSGQRALNFVLENPRVDRTLLFNVKLIRVDKKDGRGGFVRG